MPAGASLTPGLLTRPETEKLRSPLRPLTPLRREPGRALFEQVAHPVQRLEVVLQRRPAEQAHLRDIRRAQPRQAALALDRFDHRRLFAADVGAGAAAQLDRRQRTGRRVRAQLGQLGLEQRAAAVVLVAQVHVDRFDAHRPGGDQQAFDEAVRIALEVDAVLERAGLAFVDVHRHQARRRLVAHDAPLAPGRETRAAQAAQARVFQRLDHALDVTPALQAIAQHARSRLARRSWQVDVGLARGLGCLSLHQRLHAFGRGRGQRVVVHHRHRRLLAAADARRRDHAHLGAQQRGQAQQQILRTGHLAAQAIADAHRECRRGGHAAVGPFFHDVEVVVEARHLVHLGLRELQFLRQRGQMRRAQLAVAVVDAVQVFDQPIAPQRLILQQRAHLGERLGIDAPALRGLALALPIGRRQHNGNGGVVQGVDATLCKQLPLSPPGRGPSNALVERSDSPS